MFALPSYRLLKKSAKGAVVDARPLMDTGGTNGMVVGPMYCRRIFSVACQAAAEK